MKRIIRNSVGSFIGSWSAEEAQKLAEAVRGEVVNERFTIWWFGTTEEEKECLSFDLCFREPTLPVYLAGENYYHRDSVFLGSDTLVLKERQ